MPEKLLKIFSQIWIALAGLFILFGLVSTWYFEGFTKLQEVLSPFNIWNFIMVFIVLSPGLGAMYWLNFLEKKRDKIDNKENNMTLKKVDEILRDYGRYLELNPEPMTIRDISVLPHSKDNILTALQMGIIYANNEKMVDTYKSISIYLSDFQENIGSKPITPFDATNSEIFNNTTLDERINTYANSEFDKYEQFRKITEIDLHNNILPKISFAEKLRAEKLYGRTSV